MPRININEKDRTSPGTPGGYSNNTVLIAGFSKYTDDEIRDNLKAVQADDNGVFEFASSDEFENTIGLVAPTIHTTAVDEDHLEANLPVHYGNQMAYELLKMGYPVIYINLGVPYATAENDDTITTAVEAMRKLGEFENTWEIFKDKASYDFRFVSHGLLTSSKVVNPDELAKSDDLVKLEARIVKMTELLHMFDEELEPKADYVKVVDEVTGTVTMRDETQIEADARVFAKVCDAEEDFLYVNGDKSKGKLTTAAKNIGYTDTFLANKVCYRGGEIVDGEEISASAFLTKLEADATNALKVEFGDAFSASDFDAANAAIAKLAHYRAVEGNTDETDPASGRGDCIALVEVDEARYITKGTKRPEAQIIEAVNEMAAITADNGKYCACTVPSVVYKMSADERFDGNKKFPGAFHYLACFKNSLGLGFAEWYAAAGYTRGVSSYTIDHTTVKLGEVAIQALEPRNLVDDPQKVQPKFACNVIANFRGSYYLWGNRTCHPLGSAAGGNDLVASHFLNIRQLCTTIKKQLYVSCRRFTFDPNSDVLWINFKNSITPMLDRMKADQGVRDYKIEKVYTDKKATLKARIRIVPIEAVEDFLLEVSLEDSLGETAVTIAE